MKLVVAVVAVATNIGSSNVIVTSTGEEGYFSNRDFRNYKGPLEPKTAYFSICDDFYNEKFCFGL